MGESNLGMRFRSSLTLEGKTKSARKKERIIAKLFGNIRKNLSQGNCVEIALNTSFDLLSKLAILIKFYVCFDSQLFSTLTISLVVTEQHKKEIEG